MITLHHLEDSRSLGVAWLLEELDADYELVAYRRDPETGQAPTSLRDVHPLGKAPVIVDGGTTIAESGAIIEYLVDTFGKDTGLKPAAGSPERLAYNYWLHYAEGPVMVPILLSQVFARLPQATMPFFVRPSAGRIARWINRTRIRPQITMHLDFMESELGKSPWFAGTAFTAADIQMSYPVEESVTHFGLGAHRRRLLDWLLRTHARPARRRAIARIGAAQSRR